MLKVTKTAAQNFAFVCFGSTSLMSASAVAVSNTRNCAVTFAKSTAKLNPNALESCLALISRNSVSTIQVVAFGGKEGSAQSVRALSIHRATAVAQFVRKRFPGINVTATGAGQDLRRGAVARVSATMHLATNAKLPIMEDLSGTVNAKKSNLDLPDAPPGIATATSVAPVVKSTVTAVRPTLNAVVLPYGGHSVASSALSSGMSKSISNTAAIRETSDVTLRAAVRGGADLWVDSNRGFPTLGIEFAWLPKASELDFSDNEVRLELGALTGVMTRDEYKNVYNVNAFGGGAYKISDFALGGRVLGGAAMSNNTVVGEVGFEARGGYEIKGFSVFAGAGFTNRVARLGVDVGITY